MDLQKYITKNKKENKSMFLFSFETAKKVEHTSLGEFLHNAKFPVLNP